MEEQNKQAAPVDLIEFLLTEVSPDGMEDAEVQELWEKINKKFGHDDYVRLANVLVVLDTMPAELKQKMWDNI